MAPRCKQRTQSVRWLPRNTRPTYDGRMLQTFNNWWRALEDSIQVALLGVGGTILAAILAGVMALIVVWAQNRMARRAIEVQERTAYLTLIERRAKWLDDALVAWNGWIAEQEALIEALVHHGEVPESPGLRGIAHTRRQARWLFGPEMDAQLEQLELAVRDYSQKRFAFREIGMLTPDERQRTDTQKREAEYSQSLIRMMALLASLSHHVRPYLFVGDIKAKMLVPLSKGEEA